MNKQNEKQKLLIEYLLSSPDTFTLCKSIVKPSYFDPEFRKTVQFINKYYDEYNSVPTPKQVKAETNVVLLTHTPTRDEVKYCADEIEKFCKNKALEQAVLAAPELIEKQDHGKVLQMVTDAISVSLHRDLGLDYFSDPLTRLERLASKPPRTPTGWKTFDNMLGGGLARSEVIIFCAGSGGGKSITLLNLGLNYLQQGLNVAYLSLELNEDMISQRLDMMFTGIPTFKVQTMYKDIAKKIIEVSTQHASLHIKWMQSGTTANQIKSYLKEYELVHKFLPDLLIVDYLDLMGPNEFVSADNVWEKDKRTSEQLRDLGAMYGMFIASASQLNRSAIEAQELHQGHTAGGISKVYTVDWQVAIVQTPPMKSAGEITFIFLKSRSSDAVGKSVHLVWDNSHLRILSPKGEDDEEELKDEIKQRSTKGLPGKSKKSLLDIME